MAFVLGPDSVFGDLVRMFFELIMSVIPLVASLALLAFFWGLVKFISNVSAGSKDAVSQGKSLMIWGIVALFIMVSLWGVLRFAYGEFGFTGFGIPTLPTN